MNTAVAGLDLSLTGTGTAWIGTGLPVVSTIKSVGHLDDSLAVRDQRLTRLANRIIDTVSGAALVVIEGPSMMSKGGSMWDRAGLWWMVVHRLQQLDIPVAVAAPTTLKKFAAGTGSASKTAVAAGMTRLWPEITPRNDNEFDALAAATVAAQHMGLDVPVRAHHAATLAGVMWPEFGGDLTARKAS